MKKPAIMKWAAITEKICIASARREGEKEYTELVFSKLRQTNFLSDDQLIAVASVLGISDDFLKSSLEKAL